MGRLTKRLGQMKHILYGEAGDKDVDQHKCEVSERQLQKRAAVWRTPANGEALVVGTQELGEHVVKENLAPLLLEHLSALPFEARKVIGGKKGARSGRLLLLLR